MEFQFDVDPEQDFAVGTELSFEESEGEFQPESFEGIDPLAPTPAKPGSDEKVRMLAARYAAGVPLWHNDDCYDHGPSGAGVLAAAGLNEEEDEEF